MQRRLKGMEDEAEKLKGEHEKVDDAMAAEEAGKNPEEEAAKKQEADARSVYVGQVDYASTPEDLANAFASAGTCLLYTSPSPRDKRQSRMPSSA